MDLIPIQQFDLAAIDQAVQQRKAAEYQNALAPILLQAKQMEAKKAGLEMAKFEEDLANDRQYRNAIAEAMKRRQGISAGQPPAAAGGFSPQITLTDQAGNPSVFKAAYTSSGGSPATQSASGAANPVRARADQSAWLAEQADIAMAAGKIDQANKLLAESEKWRPKVKDYKQVFDSNGKVRYQPMYEDGSIGDAGGAEVAEKLHFANTGQESIGQNAFTGQIVSRVKNTQSPDSAASVAATIRGQNLTDARGRESNAISRERLQMEKDAPKGTYDSDRGLMIGRDGVARPILKQDGSQLGAKPAPANMSPTMQKELFEADDAVQSGKNVIDLLGQALKLNDKAYSGFGATTRAKAMSALPGQSAGADATIELDNIITGQAMESLKSIFGGNPTEGERAILLDIQASPSKTPEQRAAIINRGIKAAEKRMNFAASKAESLRKGTYTTTGPVMPDASASKGRSVDDLLKFYGGN
jgi:hypothetical protein